MKSITLLFLAALACASSGSAQDGEPPAGSRFDAVAGDVRAQLEQSLEELKGLRARLADEKIPLTRELNALESELIEVRAEYNAAKRELDSANLDLTNLASEIKARESEVSYLESLLGDFLREFEAGLHVAELQRYGALLESAKLAPDDNGLKQNEVLEIYASVVATALDRVVEALGGARFEGAAVGPDGLVDQGTFVLVGPTAIFLPDGATSASAAEQRLGSHEPTEIAYGDPADGAAAAALARSGAGYLPFDPTLGNAHKLEQVDETFVEHVKKGGAVMWPIGILAGAALLVALGKWLVLAFQPRPSRRKVDALLAAVARGDEHEAEAAAGAMTGPVGRMLQAGVEHMREPRELVEEVLYEKVLTTRLKLQSYLPFIAICAASAPLLGLLGTVTGIINTFKMITLFGSGDVKSLSGGISEALITTKFGLIVAIPSLLLHAFLSRKARGIVDGMERTAIAFVNRMRTSPESLRDIAIAAAPRADSAPDAELVRRQVAEILGEMLEPIAAEHAPAPALANGGRPAKAQTS